MSSAKPQTTSQEIGERINKMGSRVTDGYAPDDIEWMRLKKDIQKLAQVEEAAEHALLYEISLWWIKNDPGRVMSLLKKYLAKYGETWNWHITRACRAAMMVQDASMITDMLKFGVPAGNVRDLIMAIEITAKSGFFVSARNMLDELYVLNAFYAKQFESTQPGSLRIAANCLELHGIDEVEVGNRYFVAAKAVIEKIGSVSRVEVVADEAGITLDFIVDADIDTLVDLNFFISDMLTESFKKSISAHVSIGVIPMEGCV